MSEIKVEKNIFELLQEVRAIMAEMKLTKSGHNAYQDFDYFELKDFLPISTKLFNERGMCPIFNIITDQNGVEIAVLNIIKGAEKITFQMPTAEPGGNNAIQAAGSKQTYMRRYLYLSALDLVENDAVDAHDNSKDVKVVAKASSKQVQIIGEIYDTENIEKICQYYHVDKLADLSAKQASECIARKSK